jgi:hypothetical protein
MKWKSIKVILNNNADPETVIEEMNNVEKTNWLAYRVVMKENMALFRNLPVGFKIDTKSFSRTLLDLHNLETE